ncbi:ABC transporter permease [Ampullimonas aquatilis]|uniref:ABC transporter permease n=1 Tax=Ampullimonas aquatilis TaxID=1341549 RepID=UPI003C712EB6
MWGRILAVLIKEFAQVRRDRLTFMMMVAIPIIQLILFGFAINTDPKHLPLVVVEADSSEFSRTLSAALQNSGYFTLIKQTASEAEADTLLAQGKAQFALIVPPDFASKLVRGEHPAILLAADATDPAATGNALAALNNISLHALNHDLSGSLTTLQSRDAPFEIRVQRRYNPEGLSRYNVVPGLIGVVLTMTMVMMTALAMTRERERGTMENLLATPVRPIEVMIGKIVPYIMIGYVQVTVILVASRILFNVPMVGSLWLLSIALIIYIAANLAVGFTFSTLARNQMQAMQMTFFFFLPSMLLSGFMFPFRGLPGWAQHIGNLLPLTHFLRIVRGIMLKGNQWPDIQHEVGAILLFMLSVAAIALLRYRRTLD